MAPAARTAHWQSQRHPANPQSPIPNPQSPPSHRDGSDLAASERLIDLHDLTVSPYQKRRPDAASLHDLAESLRAYGLRQAVVVRTIGPGKYEILAGHRRTMAAATIGWSRIRCSVQEATDAEAREVVLLENLHRRDLSAVEEAESLREILDAPGGPTQEQLGRRLGKSQPYIASRLGLLRLPDAWRQAIITGAMPASYARALVGLADRPRAHKAVEAAIAGLGGKNGTTKRTKGAKGKEKAEPEGERTVRSYEEFCGDLGEQIKSAGRSMNRVWYDKQMARDVVLGRVTPEQAAELDVVEVPGFTWDGRPEPCRVALNVDAWTRLAREQQAREEAKLAAGKGKAAGKPKDPEKMTPAEKRAAAAAERENRERVAQQRARRRRDIRTDWLRMLVARRIQDVTVTDREEMAGLLLFAAGSCGMHDDEIESSLEARGGRRGDLLATLQDPAWTASTIWDVAGDAAAGLFWSVEDVAPVNTVPRQDVEQIAAWLQVDLEAAWKLEQLGPLSEAWWNAHDKEELLAICDRVDAGGQSGMKKTELVGLLLRKNMPTPAELKGETKKGRGRPAKKAS